MARIEELRPEQFNTAQQALYDKVLSTRQDRTVRMQQGKLGGPFSVWLRTPEIADSAERLTNCFRLSTTLDKRLIELIVLLVCRDATAEYAWSVHEPLALTEGLTRDTVEAIRARRKPDFKRDDERTMYDLVTELLATRRLTQQTYDRAVAAFGLERVIEAVSCVGCYGMIGLVLNAFEIPPREGMPRLD